MKDAIETNQKFYNSNTGPKNEFYSSGIDLNFDKKQLSWRHVAQAGEWKWGGIQTTIDTYRDIIVPHSPHHVEENMPEKRSRRRLVIFGRRMKQHAPLEKRASEVMHGAFINASTVTGLNN